jgi:hypothetical protein
MIVLLFCLLVAGATTLAILAYFSPHLIRERAAGDGAGIVAGTLAVLTWLAMRPRLPLAVTLSEWPEAALLPPWNWRVDAMTWHVTGVVLLLTLAALLVASGKRQAAGNGEQYRLSTRTLPPAAYLFLLAAATLAALWADSLAGMLAGWMLLAVVWAATLWLAGDYRANVASWLLRVGWLLASLFALWLGAAGEPGVASPPTNSWPATATTALLLAASLQMGVWPLSAWRPLDNNQLAPAAAAMIHVLPTVAGAGLLARLMAGGSVNMAYTLLLTAWALLGCLRGVRLAWAHLQEPAGMAAALALVQTSIILLAGVWAGPAAVIAEVRVLVLAVGMLFLVDGRPVTRTKWWRAIGPMVAVAALAGLPFTAGFAGRAALYDAWLANDRFVLVLVAALLHVPLVAAVLVLLWPRSKVARSGDRPQPGAEVARSGERPERGGVDSAEDRFLGGPRNDSDKWLEERGDRFLGGPRNDSVGDRVAGTAGKAIVYEAGLLLAALGLLSPGGLGQADPVTWLALGAAAAAGFALSRFIGEVREARAALRQAFTVNLPLEAIVVTLRRLGQGMKAVLGEAVLILEGEGGLLWLLVLVVVFWLAL